MPGLLPSREEIERICMRNLMESTEECIFFKDLDSRFLAVSAGWLATYFDGGPVEALIGKTDFDIFSEPHAAAAFADEQHVIRTGRPMVAKPERETFDDRPDRWTSTSKLPLRSESGQIIGTFGLSRDITAQIQA
ncbi:MAG TPA: PAS domain-containing protein [Solirubrobacteraceae bacterium]